MERALILLVGSSGAREAAVCAALKDICEVRCESHLSMAGVAVQQRAVRAAIVDLAGSPDGALIAVAEIIRATPQLPVVVVADRKDPELILRAMRAGAREFVILENGEELAQVVRGLTARVTTDERSGSIISVFQAKGGVGATLLSSNLAGALLEGGKRVVLVDLDLQLGDALVFLDMSVRYTVTEVLENMERLDRELLLASLAQHSSGLYVLSQGDRLEDSDVR